jgi:hypothetical protein
MMHVEKTWIEKSKRKGEEVINMGWPTADEIGEW